MSSERSAWIIGGAFIFASLGGAYIVGEAVSKDGVFLPGLSRSVCSTRAETTAFFSATGTAIRSAFSSASSAYSSWVAPDLSPGSSLPPPADWAAPYFSSGSSLPPPAEEPAGEQ